MHRCLRPYAEVARVGGADHRYLCRTSRFKQRHVTDKLYGVSVPLLRQQQQGLAAQVLAVPLRKGQALIFPKCFRSRFVICPAFRITSGGEKKQPQIEAGFGKIRLQFKGVAILDLGLLVLLKLFERTPRLLRISAESGSHASVRS